MALNNVPLPGQALLPTRNPINQNFSVLDTTFAVDHVTYNLSGGGKHNKVTFPVQNPAPTFTGGDLGLYAFLNPTTAKNELYVHKVTGATTAEIPITASTLSTTSSPVLGSGSWTYLPSGLLIKSGQMFNVSGMVSLTPAQGPAFTGLLTVVVGAFSPISLADINFAVRLIDINTVNSFRVYVSSRTTTGPALGGFQYIAIGY